MRHYLDHNATSPLLPEARAAMLAALSRAGNASSVHAEGRIAREMVERARDQVAALVKAKPSEVIFTSGGTEANVLALAGSGASRFLIGATEHDAVTANARRLGPVETIPCDADGLPDLTALTAMLARGDRPALVSLMLANNETGVIGPIRQAADAAALAGALCHTDASQALGKMEIDFGALNAGLMSLSAHKFGGPQGAGALILREGTPLSVQMSGGGQERGLRAGTENVAAIAGFGAACEVARTESWRWMRLSGLQAFLESDLADLFPEIVVHGAKAPRLPNTSLIGLPGLSAETQVIALDMAGFSVSAGAACSSGKVRASHVLTAMGRSKADAATAIRISLGWDTHADAIRDLQRAYSRMAGRTFGARTKRGT
jgi:cysteine desulfurase